MHVCIALAIVFAFGVASIQIVCHGFVIYHFAVKMSNGIHVSILKGHYMVCGKISISLCYK